MINIEEFNVRKGVFLALVVGLFMIISMQYANAQQCNWVYKTTGDYRNLLTGVWDESMEECFWAPWLSDKTTELHQDYLTKIDGCTYFRSPYRIAFFNISYDEWINSELGLVGLKKYIIKYPHRGMERYGSFSELYFCEYKIFSNEFGSSWLPFPIDELNYVIDSAQLHNYINYTEYIGGYKNKTCRDVQLEIKARWECYNLSYYEDKYEYCTSWPEEGWQEKVNEGVKLIMGNITKPKMLETISQQYFNEHFDLKRVVVPTTHFVALEFTYLIDEYNLSYRFNFGTYWNGTIYFSFQPPREVQNVVNKDFVEDKAKKCIDNTNVEYNLVDYRAQNLTPELIKIFSPTTGFELAATGNEIPLENQKTMKIFAMNLETGRFVCQSIPNTYYLPIGTKLDKKIENLPDSIILTAGVVMIILSVILILLWKFKRKI